MPRHTTYPAGTGRTAEATAARVTDRGPSAPTTMSYRSSESAVRITAPPDGRRVTPVTGRPRWYVAPSAFARRVRHSSPQ